MYKSTDNLVDNEQGASSRAGYQSVEGNTGSPSSPVTFLAQVRQAKQESAGCCDFCLTFFGLLLGSIVWTIVLVITLTLPLVMIVIGSQHIHECPDQRMVPVFLIVAGCFVMLSNVINLVDRFRRFSDPQMPKTPTVIGWITTIINIFLFLWFFCGCYWVFSIFKSDFGQINCDDTLYSFTFWMINACFIFFGSLVVAVSFGVCLAFLCW